MTKPILIGRIWILAGPDGKLIEDIDTDQIYHNQHLHITRPEEMGQYALGNLPGWKDFSRVSASGDILIAGRNFGAGSSRQQAVDCFISLGVQAILAVSFGAIYFRNAVNSGFPVLNCPVLPELTSSGVLKTGDQIGLDYIQGKGRILKKDIQFEFNAMSRVQHDLFEAGGLFDFGRILNGE